MAANAGYVSDGSQVVGTVVEGGVGSRGCVGGVRVGVECGECGEWVIVILIRDFCALSSLCLWGILVPPVWG